MKLQRWRCGTCGFEWFEPLELNRSDYTINHGCPQGCDNAGKVFDTVEATDNEKQWICWVLSKGDIDLVANKADVKAKEFTDNNYEEIARNFIKGFEWANEEWADILEDAIKEIMR